MKDEELKSIIEVVASEVIKRLNAGGIYKGKTGREKKEDKRKLLLVFTGGTGGLDMAMEQLSGISAKYDFYVIMTPAAEKIIGLEKVKNYIEFLEIREDQLYEALSKVETVVFPTLTQNTAAKAAIGIRDSAGSEAMACSFLMKKNVIAAQDGIPVHNMPATYAHLCSEILKKLCNLGMHLCEARNLGQKIMEVDLKKAKESERVPEISETQDMNRDPESQIGSNKVLKLQDNKLITADIVNKAASGGFHRIMVPREALITPMARDTAGEKKIEIVWMVK